MEGCSSSEDSDYEPAPLGRSLLSPPLPPPRGMSLSHHSYGSMKRGRNTSRSSLFHTLRKSMSKDLTLLVPEETLKICQFITRHSTQLPCQVKLLETSTAFPQPLPEDRIINLHFMKHSKVVIMRDSASGDMISVPLNSAAKFGLLYNPCSNAKKAMNGYNFHTAREIMATKPLPFLVQATQSYQGSSATTSVVQGEILCIKGVKTFLRSKQLRVQNMQGENKLLSEKCCGSFTTAPAKLSMPLLPLLKFDTELPATVATSVGRERGHSSVLEMERIAGETCLIASYPTWQYTKQHYFEITSDVDISVESVKMDSSLKHDLLTDTQALFHTFSRSAVPIVSEAHAQRGVSGELLPGEERHGVQLVRPINIDILPFEDSLPTSIASQSHEPIISRLPVKMAAAAVDSESEEIYCVLDAIKPESHESSESSLMTSQPPSRHPRMSVREQPSGDNDMVWINLMSKVEDMSSAYLQKLNCIQEELQSLQSIVLNIQKTVQHFQPAQPVVNEEHEKNKREIACLDCNQVVSVLRALDLPEYVEVFLQARVDGLVLLELTDNVLLTELGVDSKLHRIRIMNLVAGKIPTETLSS